MSDDKNLAVRVSLPPELAKVMSEDKYARIITSGDFSGLSISNGEQAAFLFLHAVKKGYDPWSAPFQFIQQKDGKGGSKLVLYARKEAATQRKTQQGWTVKIDYAGALRLTYSSQVLKNADGSERIEMIPKEYDARFYEVVASVYDADGEFLEQEVGVYPVGEDRTLSMAYTRAKRRAILAAAGISENDESEFTPRPAMDRVREGVQRVAPPPETPSLPPAPAVLHNLLDGTVVDAKTGEVVDPVSDLHRIPAKEAGPAALPRKVPPSTGPIKLK